jgi:protocatechuate 3,4-dioxygenase beta subunit
MQMSRTPEGYVHSYRRQNGATLEVTKSMEWPTVELTPAASLDGVVVDDEGKLVAGAEVWYLTSNEMHDHGHVETDASGKFTLKKGAGDTPVALRVRTKEITHSRPLNARHRGMTSDGPVNVTPAKLKEPVKLVVSKKFEGGLKGRIVGKGGRPLPGAKVGLRTTWMVGGGGIGFQLLTTNTDVTGNFVFDGLWPGDSYRLMIEADGYAKQESKRITAEAGKTHDYGEIRLASTQAVVEGSVVDSAGKPLADVRVFNSGDAPEMLATKTDAKGQFRLRGFRAGDVWVFAQQKGYRFTADRVESDGDPVKLVMLRDDEPTPSSPWPVAPTLEERKELVRKAIERLREARGTKEMQGLIRPLAHIDAEAALSWSKRVGGRYDRTIYETVAGTIAPSDIEEALSLLTTRGRWKYYSLKELGGHLEHSHPEAALRCAEEMVPLARTLDQPQRSIALAETGGLIFRCGNREAGAKLIDEAAKAVEKMGSGKSQKQAAQEIAGKLALVDPDRAVALLEKSVDLEKKPYRLRSVAIAAAVGDLAKGQKILKGMQSWYAEDAVAPIAYRLARSDPDKALKFVRDFCAASRPQRQCQQQALGWIAAACASKDSKKACEIIDEALDLCVTPSRSSYRDRQGMTAAFLAVQAKKIRHPDMERVVWQVFASRATTKDAWSPNSAMERNVATAMVLALAEPAAAREMLAPYAEKKGAMGTGGTGIGKREWVKASVLASSIELPKLIDHELELAKTDKKHWDEARWSLIEALETLVMPPEQRLEKTCRYMGGLWVPSRDR